MQKRHYEGLSIFSFHGLLDSLTTVYASRILGPRYEANPILRHVLMDYGEIHAGFMIVATMGLVAFSYVRIVESLNPGNTLRDKVSMAMINTIRAILLVSGPMIVLLNLYAILG